jgi:holo-[acyl-carrier protein] synthase
LIKIGTDICSVNRVTQVYERFGERFLDRILTDSEKRYVLKHPVHTPGRLAARFAVKEAASKALGTGWSGISFKEIEVVKQQSGEPALALHGRAKAVAEKNGLTNWQVSLSHEKEFATAVVLAHTGTL